MTKNYDDDVQAKLAKFEERYKMDYINSDTIAAIMTIEKHKSIIFNNIESKSILTRRDKTFKFLKKNYPNMDILTINRKLTTSGYFSYWAIACSTILMWGLLLLALYILLGIYFGYTSMVTVVTTILTGIVIFMGIMIWMAWVDIYD